MPIDPKEVPEVVSGRTSGLPQRSKEGQYTPLSLDQAGRLRAILKGAVEDGVIPADALQGVGSLPVEAFTALWNATAASWDRMRSTPDNADGIATGDTGLAGVVARALLYDTVSGAWDRARSTPDNADGIADGDTGLAGVVARVVEWNGASWDRARAPSHGTNSFLTGLTTAANASENISIDLGPNFTGYREAFLLFSGLASSTNFISISGRLDPFSPYNMLINRVGSDEAAASADAKVLAVGAQTMGFRFIQFQYDNGATAQTSATLLASVQ